jgi:hypothetical protein
MPDKNQLPSSIQSQDQATAAFAQLIEDSTTALNIVSQRLNPALFNELSLMESLRQKVLDRRRLLVRVLVREPRLAVANAPRLLALSRRLGSNFELRALRDTSLTASMIICDRQSMIYRPSFERWDGQLIAADPVRIKNYLEAFAGAWDNAAESPELRDLRL